MANTSASSEDETGIAPVLVNQVFGSATKNGKVCVLGIVRNIETSSTRIVYTLEDSTGRIEVHYWLDEGNTLKAPDILLNKYAKVYASVKSHDGQIILSAYDMFPISDPNAMVTHNLEVMGSHFNL